MKFRWRCLVLQIGLSLPRSKVSGWLTTRNQPKNVLSYRHAALHSLGSTPAALDLRRFRVSVQETENIDFLMFSVQGKCRVRANILVGLIGGLVEPGQI